MLRQWQAFRRGTEKVVTHSYFENVVLLLVLASSISLVRVQACALRKIEHWGGGGGD